ncbi:MAG: Stp1/IreP family PP2C-type Ser/Thr phosphatase [Limnochordia bacterium]|nr:Stp1/IreP family PP2C-type Ser/Thr phosphatase [Limnochordia bacterium]MDD2629102.1 Stp1/IreP family PP2C-type Ser/Thr phosphatase [Limnochordia bacterium]MDD4517296.1 Stp1/IreP family PP2C-type Ser/Thr phosphatase [Limnochordia bacterium]
MRIRVGARTDTGLMRSNNEDGYLVREWLFAVADGMGGHSAGEVASYQALLGLSELCKTDGIPGDEGVLENHLRQVFERVNQDVHNQARACPGCDGMGTTLTAMGLTERGYAYAHVGDSRLYLFRDGLLTQVTSDHSLVAELVRNGTLSRAEAYDHPLSNVLSRAIGVEPEVKVETGQGEIYPGDVFLLCTDGIAGPVEDRWVSSLLSEELSPQSKAEKLVERALELGSTDNVTAVVVQVDKDKG